MAKQWGKRYSDKYKTDLSWDEIYSAAQLLFINCLRSFDPDKGLAFSTYYMNAAKHPSRYMTPLKSNYHRGLGYSLSVEYLIGLEDDGDRRKPKDKWQTSDECVETQALDSMMSQKLHAAIAKLPPELRKHAHETLSGNVCWKDTASTVATRRKMLAYLRAHMGDAA